jgi:hypothetical protein
VARSSSKLSRFAYSTPVRILCCISCLCILFVPILCCLRRMGSLQAQIVADYNLLSTYETFIQQNSDLIINAVTTHSKRSFVAHFE